MGGSHPASKQPPPGEAPESAAFGRIRRRSVFALLLLLPAPAIGTTAALFIWPEEPVGKLLFIASKFWILILPLAWLRLVERQPIHWSPPRKGGFGLAALTGFGIAAVILLGYRITLAAGLIDPQMISDRAARTGLDQLGTYLAGAAYWITLNSLMEEYVWRWFVFRHFEVLWRGKLAILATSLAFTVHHVIALAAQFSWLITVAGSLGVFIGGMTWSWLYLRCRSVWPCYLSHAIVDMPVFWIGYDLIFSRGG